MQKEHVLRFLSTFLYPKCGGGNPIPNHAWPRCGGRHMKDSATYPEQFADFIAGLRAAAVPGLPGRRLDWGLVILRITRADCGGWVLADFLQTHFHLQPAIDCFPIRANTSRKLANDGSHVGMVSCQHDVQQFNNVSFQAILLFDFCRFSLQSVPRWCKQTQVEENQLPEVHIPEEDLQNLTPLVTCLFLWGGYHQN